MFFSAVAHAGEMDALVNKLVEKGVLTQGEAQQMMTEAKEEARAEIAQGKNETLPKWLQTTKFKGDLRIRYQGETRTGSKHRDRGRFRLRYGFETKPNELMKVAFKMASGENKKNNGPEQTSTNQTFTNAFQNKHIWIDQAYVDFTPFAASDMAVLKDLKLTGGKFPNPYYTTDLVWDSDINPEGGVIRVTPQFGSVKSFFSFGFHPLGEDSSDSNDPKLYAWQAGFSTKVLDRNMKLAGAYYNYDDIKGMPGDKWSPNYTPTGTNTFDGGTNLKYDYNIVAFTGEFSPFDITMPVVNQNMPFTVLFDYANNVVSHVPNHTAWLLGCKLGKAKEKGTFELFYNYREIGQNAVVAYLNDSDFHAGGTGAKGHKFGIVYALMPNSTLGMNYLITDPYKVLATGSKKHIDIYQVDWVTKF
jgi:hypothetical protein